MTRPILILVFLLGLANPIKAQTATDPNEGSRMSRDSATGVCTFNWWGRSGMSYFVKCSEDMVNWSYLPTIVVGTNAVAGINYQTNAVRFFMRLEIESNPFNTDSDGDGMSDGWEVLHGFNPHSAADALDDADGDGVPNIFEYKLGATDPQDPNFKPAATFTVDPSVTADAPPVYKKIQSAIDAVADGAYAYISIKPGSYVEDVSIFDKHILLMAQTGPSPVILSPASSYSSYAAIIIYGNAGDTTLSGLNLRPANPGQAGQGIYVSGQDAATRVAVTNCVIQGFASDYGGAMFVYQAQVWVTHCTFAGNTDDLSACGIYIGFYASLRLRNSILWDSLSASAPELAGAGAAPDITVQYSIVRGGSQWGGINTDPHLTPYSELTAASAAAIDQGRPLATANNPSGVPAPHFDIHGEPRQATQPDIGADEFVDSDGDGLPDWWEMKYFGNLGHVGTGDYDGDGLTNQWEYYFGFEPLRKNTLGTGISDLWNALDQAVSLVGDGTWQTDDDHDGLTKIQELIIGTNPNVWDTFGTGLPDSALLDFRLLPLNGDWDGDGLNNLQELIMGTDPFNSDTDGDGYQDGVDAYPLNTMLHDPIASDPSDTTPPVIQLYEPSNAVRLLP